MGEFLKKAFQDMNRFEYDYSAKEQAEVEAIKKKYLPKEEDKMETLRKLDRSAEKTGTAYAIAVGTVGALVFGGGMSLVMTVGTMPAMIGGIMLGLAGAVPMGMAYSVYRKKVAKQREKIAPQVLALTEELSN